MVDFVLNLTLYSSALCKSCVGVPLHIDTEVTSFFQALRKIAGLTDQVCFVYMIISSVF